MWQSFGSKRKMMKTVLKYWALLVAMLSGFLLAMCYPGFDVAGFVWIWSVPLFAGLWIGLGSIRRKRRAFAVGWLAGFVFWFITLRWLLAMGDLEGVPVFGAWLGWIGLSVYLAIYVGIWAMFVATIGNPWRKKPQAPKEEKKLSRLEQKIAAKKSVIQAGEKKRTNIFNGFGDSMRVMRFGIMHASLWVMLEWVRGWLFTGFGWNGLGVALHENSTLIQIADIVGVTGLSFLPILLGSMACQLAKRLFEEAKNGAKFKAHWEIFCCVGLVALTFMYGMRRISTFHDAETFEVRVLLVQENISQSMKWDRNKEQRNYQGYEEAVNSGLKKLDQINIDKLEAAAKEHKGEAFQINPNEFYESVDLVMLPESALTKSMIYLPNKKDVALHSWDEELLKKSIMFDRETNRTRGLSVIYGANMYEGKLDKSTFVRGMNWTYEGNDVSMDYSGKSYNVLALATSDLATDTAKGNEAVSTYAKVHLVPFGEYFPDIPFKDAIAKKTHGKETGVDFNKGESLEPLKWSVRGQEMAVIPAVCFEDTVGRLTRKFVTDKPQFIANVSNIGWFGESIAAKQHLANAKFRAIELRRPMVRSCNTGVSCIVNMVGSLEDGKTGRRQVIEDENGSPFVKDTLYGYVRVPLEPEVTVYAAIGDWFVIACLVLAILTMVRTRLIE